jgi:hypothetical protein
MKLSQKADMFILTRVGRNVIKCNASHASQWVIKTNKPPFLKGDTSKRSVFSVTAATMYNYLKNMAAIW